ncbi:MAG: DUF296 domain-containing protein [Chloroflexota bacterium]|nr:DUF296 domain-containing protein [Chloroflexota bacterium]
MSTFKTHEVQSFRLSPGTELVAGLTAHCEQYDIHQALILGLGAVREPEIGSYSFEKGAYQRLQLAGDWELLTLNANVSLKEGRPFIHPHVILGNSAGEVRGGHLFSAEVLVAEIFIHVLEGEPLERVLDAETGLSLWPAGAVHF